MAKKEKIQLTPEEIEAKKIRRSNGWTRFWAIVVALALTAGVFAFARTQGIKASEGTEVTTSESGENSNSGNNNSSNTNNNSATPVNSNTNSNTNNNSSSDNNSAAPADNSGNSAAPAGANDAASVADLINKATAAAVNAKAGYDWERHCTVENIDVGSSLATNALNSIIHIVDSNADLNSVVGGFLGRGDKQETVPKGMTLDTTTAQATPLRLQTFRLLIFRTSALTAIHMSLTLLTQTTPTEAEIQLFQDSAMI